MTKSKLDEAAASPKGHGSPSPTQTWESDAQSENADAALTEDQVGGTLNKAALSTHKELPKIHTMEEGRAFPEKAQLIDPEDVLDLNALLCLLVA